MSDDPRIEIRAASAAPAVEGRRITGHFARFGQFNRIEGMDGPFLERIEPGAYKKTLTEGRSRIRMMFQHGRDPEIGDKPIGAVEVLREDAIGPYFEGDLFDSVPPLIVDGLRAGQYGISYRFSIPNPDQNDVWDMHPRRSDYNPQGIPERTIREARVYEFGPVTFPADPGADYAVRAITLADLEAPTAPEPEQPALPEDAAAEPHVEESREADPVQPPPDAAPITTRSTMSIQDYRTLDELRARGREVNDEITRLAQKPGVLDTAEQGAFDALVAERNEITAAADRWQRNLDAVIVKAENERTTEFPTVNVVRTPAPADAFDVEHIQRTARSEEHRNQLYRDNAMRVAETMRVPEDRFDADKSRERLQNLLDYKDSADKEIAKRVLLTGSPQYRSAFHRYIASGGQERGTALAVGVDGTGGYSVPVQFDPSVLAIGAWTATNPYRQSCRVETIAGTDTWQALTSTAVVAAYAAEADAAVEQGPTFARPEYIAKRAQGQITTSHEMLADRPDLVAEMSILIAEAKDNLEEAQFTTGAGTTVYPQGIGLKDAFTRVDSVTNDTVAVADVLAVEAALPIRHRLNAAWYLTRKAIRAIQAFETTGGQLFNGTVGYPAVGNPVANRTGNTGLTLLGYPVWETPSMPWTPTTDDTTWGVLMDPRNYVIVDRLGLSVRVIADLFNSSALATGQAAIYFSFRNTARVLNVDGGRQGAVQ